MSMLIAIIWIVVLLFPIKETLNSLLTSFSIMYCLRVDMTNSREIIIKAGIATNKLKSTKTQKETMFIQMLEGLHMDEARLLLSVKNKELHRAYKGLSDSVVKEAFRWNELYQKQEQK